MSTYQAYNAYKTNATQTASPGELTLMLYNGCLKFIKLARKAIEEKNIPEKNKYLQKAQDIIQELMVNLNMDYELSHQLMQMYDYILNRLVEVNIENNLEKLAEVEGYITEFRDTWKEVIKINRQQQFGAGVTTETV